MTIAIMRRHDFAAFSVQFFVSLPRLLAFPDTSTYIRHTSDPLPPVCHRYNTFFFLFVTQYVCDVRRDRRQPQKRRAPSPAKRYRVHVERSSKTTDSSSRFRKTISILVITNRARLIAIIKK